MNKKCSIDIFTKNLKMYMEQFGKNQKEMAALVQKIKYKKNRKDPHLSAGALSVVVLQLYNSKGANNVGDNY